VLPFFDETAFVRWRGIPSRAAVGRSDPALRAAQEGTAAEMEADPRVTLPIPASLGAPV